MADKESSPDHTLHVYYTRYSSWGARVTLVISYFDIPCTVKMYPFAPAVASAAAGPPAHLGGSLLPVLQTLSSSPGAEDLLVGDSLAICEFLAERYPGRGLWPADGELRARARAAAAQMHAGFSALRDACATDFVGRYTGAGIAAAVGPAAAREARQLVTLWSRARAQTRERLQRLGAADDGFLFGGFSIADAFFWPVLWRFRSYGLPLDGITADGRAWMARMWSDTAVRREAAGYFRQLAEPLSRVAKYDDVFAGNSDIQYDRFAEDWTFPAA
ncbi:putative glutathione S transferase [Durotheca rogersii]|uniref:putative glutathione S transferase n=1 Tax=Durotheca rogersii TaxID=419775 RepID=UPI00221EFD94|nr:putative glutathione S transferase [Durotheca rogersii]KAI5853642.1 putative glutathione S transferase [Durotheca rogersii]